MTHSTSDQERTLRSPGAVQDRRPIPTTVQGAGSLLRGQSTANVSLLGTIGLIMLVVGGCDVLAPQQKHFPDVRLYAYDFFESFEECEAAQPDPNFWINCSQTAAFCPSGRVDFMVTDIVHRGTYEVDGRRVTLRFNDNPEVGNRVVFVLSADEQVLVHQATGAQWNRKPEGEAAIAEHTCL